MHAFVLLAVGALVGCGAEDLAPAALELSRTTVDFGERPLGEVAEEVVTLTHSGDEGTVSILSAGLVEGDAGVWTVERDDRDDLAPGDEASLTIGFRPDALEAYSGQVQIRTDLASGEPTFYLQLTGTGAPSDVDQDGDGFSPATGDCNEADARTYPGAPELCDGQDNDCDGAVPLSEADADFDGFRPCSDDCDDADGRVYPGADEACDDKDTDCDGRQTDRADVDGDGFSLCDGDCDDAERMERPDGVELCDGFDNDCSGLADDIDGDGDGHFLCTEAPDCDDADPAARPVVVDPAYNGTGSDGTLQAPYTSVSAALADLDDVCRTVFLAPSVYTLGGQWRSGRLRLEGLGATADEVVLDASGGAWVLEVGGGAVLELARLTVSGAVTANDGGAFAVTSASLVLEEVVATNNHPVGDGGVAWVYDGDVTLRGCVVEGNSGEDGGAFWLSDGSFTDEGGTWLGNQAVQGGALFLQSSAVRVDGSTFDGNSAYGGGGAVSVLGSESLAIERSLFWRNAAGGTGGALRLVNVDDPAGVVRNNAVQDNTAGAEGGGLALEGEGARLTVANNTFVGNEGGGHGAGLWVADADASGLVAWANLVAWSDGPSGVYVTPGSGADVGWTSAWSTTSGTDFAGAVASGTDENRVEDPQLTAFSNDGDPTDDDLTPMATSPARDTGPTDAAWKDKDGSQNDRGLTGGPGAP